MFMFIFVLVFVLLFFIAHILCMIISFLIPHIFVSLKQNPIEENRVNGCLAMKMKVDKGIAFGVCSF